MLSLGWSIVPLHRIWSFRTKNVGASAFLVSIVLFYSIRTYTYISKSTHIDWLLHISYSHVGLLDSNFWLLHHFMFLFWRERLCKLFSIKAALPKLFPCQCQEERMVYSFQSSYFGVLCLPSLSWATTCQFSFNSFFVSSVTYSFSALPFPGGP